MVKKFYLSSKEKKLAGVCGGISEYFEVDVVFVRAVFIALALCGGWGVLTYAVFWLIAPRQPIAA